VDKKYVRQIVQTMDVEIYLLVGRHCLRMSLLAVECYLSNGRFKFVFNKCIFLETNLVI
jgi:hypothetical protein